MGISTWSNIVPTILVLSTVLQAVQADSISVLPSCPGVGDPFQVTFSKDLDQNFDDNWIAIFADGTFENSQGLPEGAMWVSLCGTQTCDTTTNPSEGTVRFRGNGQAWLQSWPLQAGSYRAVLTRGEDGEIWPALAVSDVFEVGCDSAPAPAPTDSVPAPSLGSEMISIINDAISDIEDLIASNQLLIGKFLRLAFHDCVGGCDGCIDMANPDNAGLVMPIAFLEPVVEDYADFGLSRTDIWMLSAVVASKVSETSSQIDFPFQWIGRKTCEDLNNNDCGNNFDGDESVCSPVAGPHRAICHGDTAGTSTIEEFMFVEFGFDAQQTAAIMGAHSVGAMRAVNLGFEGRSGWDLTNGVLDHGYFLELVGDDETDVPEWEQVLLSNDEFDSIPPRWQFEATVNGLRLTMLNSDIAMVRNLVEGENLRSDGRVTCGFNECDGDTPFVPFITQYANDRAEFLVDYRDALEMMIENGYARDSTCGNDEVCVLRSLL